jgi:hypothetical protein
MLNRELVGLHRVEMVDGDDPLAQLLDGGRAEQALAKFGLSDQQDLEQRMPPPGNWTACAFLERGESGSACASSTIRMRRPSRATPFSARSIAASRPALGQAQAVDAQLSGDGAEQVVRLDRGRHDMDDAQAALVERLDKMADQRGLARAEHRR